MIRCSSSLVDLITPTTSLLQRSVYKTIKWKSFFGQIFWIFTFYHTHYGIKLFWTAKVRFFEGNTTFCIMSLGFYFQLDCLFSKMLKAKISLASNIFSFSSLSSPRSPPTPAAALSPGELSRPANFLRGDETLELQWLKMSYWLVVVDQPMLMVY